MTLELITPHPRSTIAAGTSVSFDVDDGYTSMLIETTAAGGTMTTVYDGTSGGAQTGYTVSVMTDGTDHTFTIKCTAGWDISPMVIRVTEDATGESIVTEFGYELVGSVRFPKPVRPTDPEDFGKLRITMSGDSTEDVLEVEWIDVVSGTPPDGMDVTNPADEKARLEALASTTDPDAIHDNVAAEVSAITEKLTGTNDTDDWLIMEDSEAGYVKKKVYARHFAGSPLPTKLADDLSCKLLYDAPMLTNTAAATTGLYSLNRTGGIDFQVPSIARESTAHAYENTSKTSTYTVGSTATIAPQGEVTCQAVIRIGQDKRVANHGNIFTVCGANSTWSKMCWGIRFWDDGSPTGGPLIPEFAYRDAANSATIRARDDNFYMTMYQRYHIAGRREDDGGGGYDVSLWVNGLKVAETLGQVQGHAADAGHAVKVSGETGHDGLDNCQLDIVKMSNTALTDSQIVGEYKKALGIV